MTQSLFDDDDVQSGPTATAPYKMRAPCKNKPDGVNICGYEYGRIVERGHQDTVRCGRCDHHCYNAPRTETGKAVRSTSTVHAAIKASTRAEVLIRANCRCELCGKRVTDTTAELHVGHVISVKRGLEMNLTDKEINDTENLMAQCSECNLGLSAEPLPLRLLVNVLMARLRRNKK